MDEGGASAIEGTLFSNPERLQEILRANLTPSEETLDIRSCEIDYVRVSASRGVLQCTLSLAHPASGLVKDQVMTVVSFGAERTRDQWEHALQADPTARRHIGPFSLPAISFVPEHDLIVQTFPYDYRLPGLIRVVEGTPELVAILFADVDEGDWLVEKWDASVVRYRPDMRAMVRVDLEARRTGPPAQARRRTYAKVYRVNDEGRHADRLLRALAERATQGNDGFSVPRPIEYVDALQTMLVREAPGDRLLMVVRRGRRADAALAVRRAARAVASLHQVTLPDGLLAPARKEKDEQLLAVAESLSRRNPDQADTIDRLVPAILEALPDNIATPTHFDLKLGHILLEGNRATILDFDKMALGDPLIDVANLVARLDAERDGGGSRSERRAGFAEAFVDEYFAHVPASWRDRFPAWFARAAILEAGTTGRGQRGRPGQRDRSAWLIAALDQAQRSLNGQLW